jgi:dihydroorotate dehydrogenase electron transfer subunit
MAEASSGESAGRAPGALLARDRPEAPFGRRRAEILRRERCGGYVVLRCLDERGPYPRAGQFYMLASAERWGGGEGERPFWPRAFSVLRARRAATGGVELRFLLEAIGPGTRRLCELAAGETLWLTGPLGRPFAPPRDGRRPLLVGGGVGIAPLAILQDELGSSARALLGFRGRAQAAAAALFRRPRVSCEDGATGHHGPVTDLLEQELAAAGEELEVYACGPPPMLEAVRRLAAERGAPAQLALEATMACGFGACFGCVVATRAGYVRLCLDGPVLDAACLDSALEPGIRR